MMHEFQSLTPEEGIKIWDIVDAMVFNFITKKLNANEKVKKELKCAKFSKDHSILVI